MLMHVRLPRETGDGISVRTHHNLQMQYSGFRIQNNMNPDGKKWIQKSHGMRKWQEENSPGNFSFSVLFLKG